MTTPPVPYAPAEWDQRLNTTDSPDGLKALLAGAPEVVQARRMVQLVMMVNPPADIAGALTELSRHHVEAVTGIRLMAMVLLGGYAEVLATADAPLQSLDPYVVEDACDAAFARGMALIESNLFYEAFAQLLLAQKLATALGMQYRAQHIEMEWGRGLTNYGQPTPARIIDAMARLPISTRRQNWGLRCLAEAYLALGDYASAQLQQERPLRARTDLGHFIAALRGEHANLRDSCPPGRYTAITEALWALRLQDSLTLPMEVESSPQGEYRILFRAWAQLRTRSMTPQAHHMLSEFHARTPDQRAHRAAALIYANAQGLPRDDIDALVAEFNAALRAMSVRSQFLGLLQAIQPRAYVLLGMLPDIHPEVVEGLAEIAILTGQNITYRYQEYRLPGRSNGSPMMVQSAIHGSTGPESRPHPMAAQRIREALGEIGVSTYVNVGGTIRTLQAFRQSARLDRQEAWAGAVRRALDWVDSPAIQNVITQEFFL